MKLISSPLRYPGAKIKLVNHLQKVLIFNKKAPRILVEPFVGGGSVFLNFLKNNWSDKAIIGDKDRLIYSFWTTVFSNSDHLINFIKKVDINLDTFNYYKQMSNNTKIKDTKKLAEACLFLNRTSFSGIIANGAGPIGGISQNSKYKIDCRFNREGLIKKIKEISKMSSRVTVLPFDWQETVLFAQKKYQPHEIFVYVDPPFYYKADRLYREFFTKEMHKKLSKYLKKLSSPWILSYDRASEIRALYDTFISRNWDFAYSINSPAKRIEKEFFITSKKLKKPAKAFLTA